MLANPEDVVREYAGTKGFFFSPKLSIRPIEAKGNSVVCVAPLAPDEVLITVPRSMLLTREGCATHGALDTHEALALEVARRRAQHSSAWIASFPPDYDTMPVFWPAEEAALLPPESRRIVAEQRASIAAFARKAGLDAAEAAWAWASVNTRCLYWEDGGMALVPVVDYLNHTCSTAEGLDVRGTPDGFIVRTRRAYAVGEEASFCYGPHENGFLLAHYGFLVPGNSWDYVYIDEALRPLLAAKQALLAEHGLWGEWTLDRHGEPDFRAEIALAALDARPQEVALMQEGLLKPAQYAQAIADGVYQAAAQLIDDSEQKLLQATNPFTRALYTRRLEILNKALAYGVPGVPA